MLSFDHRTARLVFVNMLTFLRLLAGMLTIVTFVAIQQRVPLIVLISFIWITDLLDGILARKWMVTTQAGAIFDYVVDRFNYYLVMFLLIYTGVSPFLMFPFLIRDLAYISVQIYVGIPSIRGTKAASFAGTACGYLYLLILKYWHERSLILDGALFLALSASLVNLSLRIYRLRFKLIERLKQDLAFNATSSHVEHVIEVDQTKIVR